MTDTTSTTIKHINFWWLKEPDNAEHVDELAAAMYRLRSIPGVLDVSFGSRSATDWEGPDTTFDYGMVVTFDSLQAVRDYMIHPVHLDAIGTSTKVGERFHSFYFDS